MNISDLINSPIGASVLNSVTNKLGVDKGQASTAMSAAIPVILGGLARNAQSQQGAESLNQALNKHSGGLLDNLGVLESNTQEVVQDGNGILEHIFGGQKQNVEAGISQKSGISMEKIGPLIAMLAPVVMAYVGRQKQQQAPNAGSGGLTDILGQLAGGGATRSSGGGGLMDMVGGFLDKDRDGSYLDDIIGMFGKR